MAKLSEQDRDFLKEALSIWRRKNSFESALSRAVKSKGGTYEDYIRLISEIREKAREGQMEIQEAAKMLLEPQKDQH